MRVISLGWGVQSFTLAAMAALGEIEPVNAAVHSDTTHDSIKTYEFAYRWTDWLVNHGVNVFTVQADDTGIIDKSGGVMIPAHTKLNKGMIGRQCTDKWKRAPLRRWIKSNTDAKQLPCNLLIGISLDEFQRMRDSDVKYIRHEWPLVDKRMTRGACIEFLKRNNLEVPPKSSCTFCPMRPLKDWPLVKSIPEDWNSALQADELIRDYRPGYELFVHRWSIPLSDIDLRTETERGQLSFLDDECSGMCFL